MRKIIGLFATVGVALAVSGCSSVAEAQGTPEPTLTASARATATPTPKTTPTPPSDRDGDGVRDTADDFPDDPARSVQLYYPSGDPVIEGYPVLVDTAQLDYRVASWIKTDQAVALAPGVYAGYNPAVSDLTKYLDGPADGDCAARDAFKFAGGACWNGVPASPAEPAQ